MIIELKRIEKGQNLKPTEITHYLNSTKGWTKQMPSDFNDIYKLVYLGEDGHEGDIFAGYTDTHAYIHIFQGRLNDGVY